MEKEIKGEIFAAIKFLQIKPDEVYIDCTFIECIFYDFAYGQISGCEFRNCSFPDVLGNLISLINVTFKNCEISDWDFTKNQDSKMIDFSVGFYDCTLSNVSFSKMRLQKIKFKGTRFVNVDFSSAYLDNVVFDNCDLNYGGGKGVKFSQTNLAGADFRTSRNLSQDVLGLKNNIRGARFSSSIISVFAKKYGIIIE